MTTYIVKLAKASSPTGVAFIGPQIADGFKTDQQDCAHQFADKFEAEQFADHFRGQWRGFFGFDPENISVQRADRFPIIDRNGKQTLVSIPS